MKLEKAIRTILVSALILPLLNCNKEEPIPSYIHIDKFDLSTVYGTEGSNAHKIVDAWIFVDDQSAGVYELPCTIPVLYAGDHVVKILPGVKENGISDTRIPYPFYNRYQETVTLTPGQITAIAPSTTYSQAADFSWLEDFEGSAHGICANIGTPDTMMKLLHAPADVFEMTGSGGVVLGANSPSSYFGMTCTQYVLPQADAAVFLELNYRCNNDFNIGIVGYNGIGIETQSVSLGLRPTSGWNKVYVNLTNEVTLATSSTKFAIFFSMLKSSTLDSSYFYIDNVKLVN